MSHDLDEMTKDELAEIATAMDIEGRSSMTKDDLLAAIKKEAKKGVESKKVTPIIPDEPENPRPVRPEGNPEAVHDRPTADQSSQGGTITGGASSVVPSTSPGTTTGPTTTGPSTTGGNV